MSDKINSHVKQTFNVECLQMFYQKVKYGRQRNLILQYLTGLET